MVFFFCFFVFFGGGGAKSTTILVEVPLLCVCLCVSVSVCVCLCVCRWSGMCCAFCGLSFSPNNYCERRAILNLTVCHGAVALRCLFHQFTGTAQHVYLLAEPCLRGFPCLSICPRDHLSCLSKACCLQWCLDVQRSLPFQRSLVTLADSSTSLLSSLDPVAERTNLFLPWWERSPRCEVGKASQRGTTLRECGSLLKCPVSRKGCREMSVLAKGKGDLRWSMYKSPKLQRVI